MTSPKPPISYRALVNERASLAAQLRGILDTAERQNRDLTAEEQLAFDQAKARHDELRATPVQLTSKADLIDLLRDAGVSRAAAESIAAYGYEGLGPEAELFNLNASIEALTKSLEKSNAQDCPV